jgi:hypothetical protein
MKSQVGLVWGAAAAAALASSIVTAVLRRKRRNPREKERRRLELVSLRGRVIEGYVTACGNDVIEYSYQWRGVRYEASQDISDLVDTETELHDFSGPATVKFLSARPSNSIVIAENWSGIPGLRRRAATARR